MTVWNEKFIEYGVLTRNNFMLHLVKIDRGTH